MMDRFTGGTDEGRADVIAQEPIGRMGTPDEIAAAVLWLCSNAAAFIIGHALVIDGGQTTCDVRASLPKDPCRSSHLTRSAASGSVPAHLSRLAGGPCRPDRRLRRIAASDFHRDFRPRRALSRGRLEQPAGGVADGGLPAIVLFEVGRSYFVEDGHHRVALAREQGADYIDAQVTTPAERATRSTPTSTSAQLVHTEQQRRLAQRRERPQPRHAPDAVIEFTFVDGYNPARGDPSTPAGYELARRAGQTADA